MTLSARKSLSPDTIKRMASYFARHEVDKRAKNFGNDANPSAGYIAWLLWGGEEGRTGHRRGKASWPKGRPRTGPRAENRWQTAFEPRSKTDKAAIHSIATEARATNVLSPRSARTRSSKPRTLFESTSAGRVAGAVVARSAHPAYILKTIR